MAHREAILDDLHNDPAPVSHTHPEQHPDWPAQVRLEYGMLRLGADRYRDTVLVQQQKGHMHRIAPLRRAMIDWLPGCVDVLRGWMRSCDQMGSAPRPIALSVLKQGDPYLYCLIALRSVVDKLGESKRGLATLTMQIGAAIEHEEKVRKWAKENPESFHHFRKFLTKQRATAHHRATANVNMVSRMVKSNEIAWEPWSRDLQFRVGVQLLDCIVKATGWFEVKLDPTHRTRKGTPLSAPLVLAVKEGFMDQLTEALDREEISHPEFRPTIMPPKRWSNTRDGGYWTPYVRPPRLVRFRAYQENQRARAADEYDAFDMPEVFSALHVLQETGWRINTRVLDTVKTAWAKSVKNAKGEPIGNLPELDEKPLPARTASMHLHAMAQAEAKERGLPPPQPDEQTKNELRTWKRGAAKVYDHNNKRVSRTRVASSTIRVADDYRTLDCFYFPHMLDFRGRMYSIPSFLQPQGDDLARGLLTFDVGAPITEESGGAGWLAIQLASCLGKQPDGMGGSVDLDKEPFDARIAYVEEREELWRAIDKDPLAPEHRNVWGMADKPWQALAAIFEWVAFLDHGYGFESSLPIMVDGTCNGIQHLSAMTRDAEAGYYVNLIPSDRPQDIYRHVAQDRLQPILERIASAGGEQGEHANYWLDITGWKVPRGLTKRPVMVLPYGGTRDAFFKYIKEWLDENDPEPDFGTTDEERDVRNKRLSFMAGHMWTAVSEAVPGAISVMKWLQDCAKPVCEFGQPIYWKVPSGFIVRHFYGLEKSVKLEVKLDGQRYQIRRTDYTDKLSTKDQLTGIPPNFTHSLDGAALVGCINKCKEVGITHFASVHDAYGTHAANMHVMAVKLREAFVEVHRVDNLAEYRWACQRILVDDMVAKGMDPLDASAKADMMLPPLLVPGSLDLEKVAEADYFFA